VGGADATVGALAEVIGVGVDVVDIDRFRRVLGRRPRLADRLFTDAERAYAARQADPTRRLAARFAAKEAVLKSLGVGLGACALRDIEVVRDEAGRPSVALCRSAASLADRHGVGGWHLSLSHSDLVATATAVAVRAVARP